MFRIGRLRRWTILLAAGLAALSCAPRQTGWAVSSPDERLGARVFPTAVKGAGRALEWRVTLDGQDILGPSPLGLVWNEAGPPLDFMARRDRTVSETFEMVTGKRLLISYRASEMSLDFGADGGAPELTVVVRAFDDGVAWRGIIGEHGRAGVAGERTGFRIPEGSIGWLQTYKPTYEDRYLRTEIGPGTPKREVAFPALFKAPAGWMLLTEASAYGGYPGARLEGPLDDAGLFGLRLAGPVPAALPRETPWRVVIAGRDLRPIVESVLVESLNPPSEISDTSWIEPGVAAFPWWSDHFVNGKPERLRAFIDLAAGMGWRWLEFDLPLIGSAYDPRPDWRSTPWIGEVVRYAADKGVLCYGWDALANLDTPEKREDILGTYARLGLRGIKVDYLDSDSPETMRLREDVIRDCARRRLMVSFHGETVPRGQRRKFPNVMTLEGVKGAEWYTLPEFGDMKGAAVHACTLPFTRNVVGPMDFTPVALGVSGRETTDAHELALPVVFESGWTCIAAPPEAFRGRPGAEVLERLPTAWDETRFLDGSPGEFACLARRRGTAWYIAGINAGPSRQVALKVPFLGPGPRMGRLIGDGAGGSAVVRDVAIDPRKPLRVVMAPNGGFCLVVREDTPAREESVS